MYRCRYFKIRELVPPSMLKYSEDRLWLLFDDRLLRAIDDIRDIYGSIYINSTSLGLTQCGFRTSSSTGAELSQHRYGRAADIHIADIEHKGLSRDDKAKAYDAVRKELMEDVRFDCLNFEDGITWLHIDIGNRSKRLFRP